MALKTDFVDALFEQKKIRLNENGDGTVTPVDETEYTRQGDKFGAKEINATNEAVNGLSEDMVDLKKSVSDGKHRLPQPSLRNGYLQRQPQHSGRWRPISERLSWEAAMRCRRMFWQVRRLRTTMV